MKYLKCILGVLPLLCCANLLMGQNVVAGKYKGHVVKMKYYKGSPDDIQYLEYGLVTELNKTVSRLEKEKASLQKELNKLKGKEHVESDDSLQMQLVVQERDLLARKRTIDSLRKRTEMLNDSLQIVQKRMQELSEVPSLPKRSPSADCSNIGVSYSMGIPILFSSMLNQKDDAERPLWNRRMTLSHQLGLHWGSRSLVRNGSLSLGIGLEYSRMRFAAGMGNVSNTFDNAVDIDNDSYTAYLTYRNVEENAALHYLGIPLTLSIGQPYHDRISGYFQLTVVPSFCISSSLNASGYYDLAGYYPQYDLLLEDFEDLGFRPNGSVDQRNESVSVNRFLLTGRLAGGIYLPLCQTQQGKTSPWAVKLGVKLDFSITPVVKEGNENASFRDATAYLTQNNFLSGGCRYLNPALEVGIMYVIGTKNLK